MLGHVCRNLTPGTDQPWGRLAEPLVTASLPHRKLGHHYRHNFILELNKLAKAWWPWKLPPPVDLGLEHTQVGLGLDHAVERSWKKGDPEDAGGDLEGLVEAGAEGPEFADPGAEGPEVTDPGAEGPKVADPGAEELKAARGWSAVEVLAQVGGAGWRWPNVGRGGKGAGRSLKMGKSRGEAGALPW